MGSSPFGPDARMAFLDRTFAFRNLMSKSCELWSFTKVPDYPQTYTSNILQVQEKRKLIGCASVKRRLLTGKNMG